MEKVAVLIVVRGGIAYEYTRDFVDVRIVDMDNIEAGDGPTELPDAPAWRALAEQAGLTNYRDSEAEPGYIVFTS